MISLKRVYEPEAKTDGVRILIERLWPRGVRKVDLRLDDWNKDVAPSTALRKWFAHDPDKWPEFQSRYAEELAEHPEAWAPLLQAGAREQVTLLFSSHDALHNNAVALLAFLAARGAKVSAGASGGSAAPSKASKASGAKRPGPARTRRAPPRPRG